ncbi:DUF7305 domain-containing protein [Clostridium estertheticum]|uniref:DUF7305 domain-containing protein n=1 Tax=Clostridium estertheticum TaxID=238834 RepID=UPI001C0BA5BC|nr:hypothetical protein [Clostridium estertheticum]MBU3072790.1 hypothetical protein [Clostridium estertheticum]MBU3163173.1 hypothetical protein [Clostridium estertheticum]
MIKNRNLRLKKHKGSSLLIVLAIASILVILSAAVWTGVVWEANNARNQEKKTQAYYIARSGAVATAKWLGAMSSNDMSKLVSELPLHSDNTIFGNGNFNITIPVITDGKLLIKSTGIVNNGKDSSGNTKYITDTVTGVLNNTVLLTITTAIFGKSSISLSGGANVHGDVGTNSMTESSIIYDNNNLIYGNIIIPYNAPDTVVKKPADWITPARIVNSSNMVYPAPIMPSFPSGLTDRGSISISGNGSNTISNDGYYDKITIDSNTALTINTSTGDKTIRVKNLDMIQGKIIITGGNKVNLYVDSCTNIKGYVNSDGSSNGDKSKLQIYCNNSEPFVLGGETHIYGSVTWGASDLTITGSGAITGNLISAGTSVKLNGGSLVDSQILYAPNAVINVTQGAQVKGAVIGNIVYMDGGASITLPSTLPTIPVNTDSYQISYWK